MARRTIAFLIFATVWLVVLTVAPLRLTLHIRSTHRQIEQSTSVPGPADGIVGDQSWPLGQSVYEDLAKRYPSDVRAQALAIDRQDQSSRQRYDMLLHRFHPEPWLIAIRLRDALRMWPYDDRVAGDLERPNPAPRVAGFQPPRTTLDQLASDIAAARLGQKREPHNTYFDWMLAGRLFAAHRDLEALQVLHEAAPKQGYDGHVYDDARTRIALLERIRPLLLEEKILIVSMELLPQYAYHRHVARLALWQGMLAQRAGDDRRALQIYEDVARLGATMRREDKVLIGAQVGQAIRHSAWTHVTAATARQGRAPELFAKYVGEFATYATAHGRKDLAEAARRDVASAPYFRARIDTYAKRYVFGIPLTTLKPVLSLGWLEDVVMTQLQWLGLLWIVLALLAWLGRRKVSARSLDVAVSATGALCLCAVLSISAVKLGAGWVGSAYTADGSAIDAMQDRNHQLAWLIVFAPAVAGAVYCLAVVAWRRRKHFFRTLGRVLLPETAANGVPGRVPDMAHRTVSSPRARRFRRRRWVTLANWGLPVGLYLLAWFLQGVIAEPTNPSLIAYGPTVLVAVGCMGWWAISWRWLRRPRRPLSYALCWYRDTIEALLVVMSVVLLTLFVGSLPVRHRALVDFEHGLSVGETALALPQVP